MTDPHELAHQPNSDSRPSSTLRRRPHHLRSFTRLGKAASIAALLSTVVFSTPASAYSTPGVTTNASTPAEFLPAPNPVPYCDSPDYFGTVNESVELVAAAGNYDVNLTDDKDGDGDPTNDTGNQHIDQITLDTGPSGITLTATTTADGGANGGVPTPSLVGTGGNISNGVVAGPGAQMNIAVSEPLFFSQWIFTDVDKSQEGFEVTPVWAGPPGDLAAFGGNPDFAFVPTDTGFESSGPGSSNTLIDFNDTDAASETGATVGGRVQVDFFGAVTGLDFVKTGVGGAGFVVGGGCPALGAAKTASASVWNTDTGQFDVTYTINVVNNLPNSASISAAIADAQSGTSSFVSGTPTEVDNENLQVTDALDLTGFSAATVTSLSSPTLTVNAGYDGVGNTSLLAGTDTLGAEEVGTIDLMVSYTPDLNDPSWADCNTEVPNQAEATAVALDIDVADRSDDGTDPSPAADNGSGTTNDPTRVAFDLGEDCASIGLAKAITDGPTSNGDGSYTLEYTLEATNVGAGSLTNPVISDDLASAFAAPASFTSTVVSDSCVGATLNATDTCKQVLSVTFTPGNTNGPFENSATVTADGPDGPVTDTSEDGADSDPDGDNDPANNSDPTSFALSPQIALSKELSAEPINNGDGTYTLEYTLVATNTGSAFLDNVAINDDLATTFGASLVSSSSTTNTCTGSLDLEATCSQVISVIIEPGSNLGPYENVATVSADGPGGSVSDDSNDGSDADPDGDDDPTNNSDPTIVSLLPPTPEDDKDLDNPIGSTVTVDPLANDDGLDPTTVQILDPATGTWLTELVVNGEGTWTVDPATGEVTFVPEDGFSGNPTPVDYRAKVLGTDIFVQATITVTYTEGTSGTTGIEKLAFTGTEKLAFTGVETRYLWLFTALLIVGGGLILVATRNLKTRKEYS